MTNAERRERHDDAEARGLAKHAARERKQRDPDRDTPREIALALMILILIGLLLAWLVNAAEKIPR